MTITKAMVPMATSITIAMINPVEMGSGVGVGIGVGNGVCEGKGKNASVLIR